MEKTYSAEELALPENLIYASTRQNVIKELRKFLIRKAPVDRSDEEDNRKSCQDN